MNEIVRVKKIVEYSLHLGGEDPVLSDLMLALAELCKVPMALVSIIDEHEQFFKGHFGPATPCNRKQDALCNIVVEQDAPLVIADAQAVPEYQQYPAVRDEPHIRFYAGVPLRLNQIAVGAVCIVDTQSHAIDPAQLELLRRFSEHVSHYLTLVRHQRHLEQEHNLMDHSPAVIMKWRNLRGLELMYVSRNIESMFGIPVAALKNREALFEDYILPKGLDEFNFLINNHMNGVEAAEAHFQLQASKNKSYWVKLLSNAFFGPDGKLDAIHAMMIDYTNNRYIEQKLTDTNNQMRLLLEASGLGTWDWNIVLDTNKVNRRWCEMLGMDVENFDASSRYWRQLVHPADLKRVSDELNAHLKGETQVYNTVYRMRHADGDWVWIETYGKVVERSHDGKPIRLAGTHRDITYKKEAELLDTKQRQLLAFVNKAQTLYLQQHNLSQACQDILPELIDLADSQFAFIGQMRTVDNKSGLFIHAISDLAWNEQSQQLLDLYRQGKLFFQSFDNLFGRVITSRDIVLSNDPMRDPHAKGLPSGHPKIFRFLGLPIKLNESVIGMIGLANKFSDYTLQDAAFLQPLLDALAGLYYAVELEDARALAEAQLKVLAMTDSLTGMANRRAFMEQMQQWQEHESQSCLAILDIDFFKKVNDSFGHQAGDHVLQSIAKTISNQIRSDDFAARMGGEEFAILLRNIPINEATALLEQIRLEIQNTPLLFDGFRIEVSASIGACFSSEQDLKDLTQLMAQADDALYQAKANGRNQLVWFQPLEGRQAANDEKKR